MKEIAHTIEEMNQIAQSFVVSLVPGQSATVVALSGDLGSGKTAFSQGVARALGVAEHITSPTFVIQKIYLLEGRVFERLVHMDAYRLTSAHELSVVGWDELLQDPMTLVLLEWPENVSGAVPKDAMQISFTFVDEHVREVSF